MQSKIIDVKEERRNAYKRQEALKARKLRAEEKAWKEEEIKDKWENYFGTVPRWVSEMTYAQKLDKEVQLNERNNLVDKANEMGLYQPMLTAWRREKEKDLGEAWSDMFDASLIQCGVIDAETGEVNEYFMRMYEAVKKDSNAYRQRVKRLANRSRYMYSFAGTGKLIFMTLTLSDKSINNNTEETLRRQVARYCKAHGSVYVANADHGDKNGRLHYHGLIVGDFNLKKWKNDWKYGHSDFEVVGNKQSDVVKVSKYIDKLDNHAIKKSTKGAKLIYSRDVPEIEVYGDDYRVKTRNGWLTADKGEIENEKEI